MEGVALGMADMQEADQAAANIADQMVLEGSPLDQELMALMLESKQKLMSVQPPSTSITKPKTYFQRAKEILFDSENPERVIAQIWDDDLTLGVCAKALKQGDVAWKCEDCEKDPTCIICLDCFTNSDHEGHRTWLKTNVSGCCDCGDPEGWEMAGACTKHKGIDSSKDEALDALPDTVKTRAPEVFKSLAKLFKHLLLLLLEKTGDAWNFEKGKRVIEIMIGEFIEETSKLLQDWKQCIFYLSEAYLEVFPGAFPLNESHKHQCCTRYFPDDEFRSKYEEEVAIHESMATSESVNNKKYCTCTVVDLMFIADQKYDMSQKLCKKVTQQCIQLFQSYNFKQHLAFGYIANMETFLRHGGEARGMAQLGVQILTMDSVTSRIFKNPSLTANVSNTLSVFIKELIDTKAEDIGVFYQCRFLRYDLKYLAKPNIMAQLVQETGLIPDILQAIHQFHFADVQKNSTEMAEFGDMNTKFLQIYAITEMEMTSVIESKYLSFIKRHEEVKQIFAYFKRKFSEVNNTFEQKHSEEGFASVPTHRLFAFFLTRLLMKHYACNVLLNVKQNNSQEEQKSETCRSLPPTNFHDHLVSEGLVGSSDQLQTMIDQALLIGARQMGFIAEVDAKKWIYKGDRFQSISSIEHESYQEKYLRMIALFQSGICASKNKSGCIDILINNFCVDEWLVVYLMSLKHPDGPIKEMFEGQPNFDVAKLAIQVQMLFLKLIEIAITEASFLLPSQKKLLEKNSKGQQLIEEMFSAHLRRELMHVLFSQGANATIDQIKKVSQQAYLKSDKFTQAVIDLSTSQTDASGKKQFRLNQKGKHEAMFDPYYIHKKKQESALQTAYDQFYKNNPNCNNYVGDYQNNYKYQTSINRECWQAMAQSSLLAEVVSKTVKECLKVWLYTRDKQSQTETQTAPDKLFKQELFPMQTLYMGLKLMIIICQNMQEADDTNNTGESITIIKDVLSSELLTEAFNLEACKDKKLSDIGLYLKQLIYKEGAEKTQEQAREAQNTARNQAEAAQAKKAMAAKKKAALLAKMKKKQTNFMSAPNAAKPTPPTTANPESVEKSAFDDSPMQDESSSVHAFSQACSVCQEPLDVNQFYERPFAQLCYLSQSKLLYYTSQQTVANQKQGLKNLRDAQTYPASSATATDQHMTTATQEAQQELEERKTPSVGSQSQRDSQSEVSGAAGQGQAMAEDPHIEWDQTVMKDLQLEDVIDEQYKVGVSFQKCCHAFHIDCLQKYQTTEDQMNHHSFYVKQMVGYDDNCIQCPMCQTFKNTWQPFLPLGFDNNQSIEEKSGMNRISSYVEFCSKLITNHRNSAQSWNNAGDRKLEKEILAVDIRNNPEKFILNMSSVVTHMLLESSCLKNQSFLAPFNPQTQQNDVLLREVVYIILTVRELLIRLPCAENPKSLPELAELILTKLSSDLYEEGGLQKNLQKLLVRFLFISAVTMDIDMLNKVKTAVIQALYSTLKAQSVIADVFRKNFGQLKRGQLESKVEEAQLEMSTKNSESVQNNEQIIESQLTYLRSATSMSLAIDALSECYDRPQNTTSFDDSDAMQLYLNQGLIDQVRQQIDDQAEYNLLVAYLGLNTSLAASNIMDSPGSLQALQESGNDFCSVVYWAVLSYSGLQKDFSTTVKEFARNAPSLNLPMLPEDQQVMLDQTAQNEDDLIGMPDNLHLLTTYYSFNFVEIPSDFQKLVKQYYTRQCRGCRKQLQESAICLLCGDIVCLAVNNKCCNDRPGMQKLVERRNSNQFFMSSPEGEMHMEGELSYHARHCEGGNSIFLVPQQGTIFMVDQGRILKGDSPYRNALGEVFSQKSSKWDNFLCSEETGGAQVMANLRKNYIEHKIPQIILQGRQSNERVILRHVY